MRAVAVVLVGSGLLMHAQETPATRLPAEVPPQITFWGMRDHHFTADGFRPLIDLYAAHSPFGLVNTTLRLQDHPLSDPAVHDHLLALAEYVRKRGMAPTLDLCVRLDRKPFRERYPEDLQQMVKLAEVGLEADGEATCTIHPESLDDHMTYYDTPYAAVRGELLRVYAYRLDKEQIAPQSVRDITAQCRVLTATPAAVSVVVPAAVSSEATTACVMACFTHLSPAVFSPHLLSYQRELIAQYADLPLAGAFKDEWGFPPSRATLLQHWGFWYSRYYADAYAEATGGRDLVADMLLMARSHHGLANERQRAVNCFMHINYVRNVEIEAEFYAAVKEHFGADAYVGKHPTWYPRICPEEYTKNGLYWWAVRRDVAQTDEITPVFACTALAKTRPCPLWYNEYYAQSIEAYHRNVWRYALAGGRQVYHAPWPAPPSPPGVSPAEAAMSRYRQMLSGPVMRSECRIRMLNFITRAPIDSPAAVVFGHAALMNWAGPYYNRSGAEIARRVWAAGYPVDLIPSTEIDAGRLVCDAAGALRYGRQRYRAAVLAYPEFEKPSTAVLLRAIEPERTVLFRIGDWTRDFESRPVDGNALLPAGMTELPTPEAAAAAVVGVLRERNVPTQAPLRSESRWGGKGQALPGLSGRCRLIDGTWIYIAAENNLEGDHIRGPLALDGSEVEVDAVGLVAVRLTPEGALHALAAGGLKSFAGGGLSLRFQERLDLALWRTAAGGWRGAVQGTREVPESMRRMTGEWMHLAVPPAPDG